MGLVHLYIVRHGETDFNLKGIIQGRLVDADLNPTGRQQAKQFFERYQCLDFDHIFTSTLRRTLQSVQGFVDKGVAHTPLSGLDELSWGIYDGMMPTDGLKPGIRRILRKWDEGKGYIKAFGGESPDEVMQRAAQSLAQILASGHRRVLVAMHGRAMRILLCHMFGKPLSYMSSFGHHNMCLYQVDYDTETAKFDLRLANDTSHLR